MILEETINLRTPIGETVRHGLIYSTELREHGHFEAQELWVAGSGKAPD